MEDLVPSGSDVSASLSGEGGGLVSFQVRSLFTDDSDVLSCY